MKKYNISKPEKYIKDGVEKTFWANVGTMTEFYKDDGSISRIIEIPAISLKANIFEIKPKEDDSFDKKEDENFSKAAVSKPYVSKISGTDIDYPEEINPADIPF